MDLLPKTIIFICLITGSIALHCDCDPRYCDKGFCETDGVCFVSLLKKEENQEIRKEFRCIEQSYLIPPQRPFLCEYNQRQDFKYVSECCNNQDYCSRRLNLSLNAWPVNKIESDEYGKGSPEESEPMLLLILLAVILPIVTVFSLLLSTMFAYKKYRRRQKNFNCMDNLCCYSLRSYEEVNSCVTQSTYPTSTVLHDYINESSDSSGSGLPLLVQRSVARQISLVSIIGQGRFGEVWKANWRGEDVAVKIFSSVDEKSWFREVEIYQTTLLRHPNILLFIAADNKDDGTWTQLWLITEFLPNGSLHDFLRNNILEDPLLMLKMSLSVVTGLTHLHMEIVGQTGKPSIAHRDIKSKNILVRGDGTLALCDFGSAVRYSYKTNVLDVPQNDYDIKVGTKRYLAPELLLNTIKKKHFDSYKQVDIYSLGLVLWEINIMQCPANANTINSDEDAEKEIIFYKQQQESYRLPYFDLVGDNPSDHDMQKVVCIEGLRPNIPEWWWQVPFLNSIAKLLGEMWCADPDARLTSLRVKKTLAGIQKSLINNENKTNAYDI